MEGVGAISEAGDVLTPETPFASNSPYLYRADAMKRERFRTAIKDLDISDFHCTQR
jgi:hypothetical protein